jgi:acetyl esterase
VALDPQAAAYLARVAELGIPATHEVPPAEGRRLSEAGEPALFGPVEAVEAVEDRDVAGVPARLYDPAPGETLPMVVYFHGGGWVVGSVNTHDGVCRALANRARCRVASVDYRLAPEHPYPAAVEDSWAVTAWALAQAPRVAVAGDSAGGGLAAVMALRARDTGLPLAFQLLVYPVLDHDFDTSSYRANGEGLGLTRVGMQWYWDQYLPHGDRSQAEASPLRATYLEGVAPALVVVCEYDVLRDEGIAYHERLREANVPARLSVYQGMIHGFFRQPAVIDRARDLLDEAGAAIREAFSSEEAFQPAPPP